MVNNRIDRHSQEWGYYECRSCGYRETGKGRPGSCPSCGGDFQNLGVPRE